MQRLNFLCACLFLLSSAAIVFGKHPSGHYTIFNVENYGAVPDGKTDSTEAFKRAWNKTCELKEGNPRLVVPPGSFLIGPIVFRGPCKRPLSFEVKGTVIALPGLEPYGKEGKDTWIYFQNVTKFLLTGRGTFDGQGKSIWHLNDGLGKRQFPNSIGFAFVNDSTVQHITSLNSKYFHMHVFTCRDVKFRDLTFIAPGDSPNTDGIHMSSSKNIYLRRLVIETGDDCVSIGDGSQDITVAGVRCGPGHGISVGSLGRDSDETDVKGLTVRNCTLTGTMNGVRIKTYGDSPIHLTASNFLFDDIVMKNVTNPIIIDQKYCPHNACERGMKPRPVKLHNVKFSNIRGDSFTQHAITLECSSMTPCHDIHLENVNLKFNGKNAEAMSRSVNAHVITTGTVIPAVESTAS